METYTVGELNENIKNIIKGVYKNKEIILIGEISNLKISGRHTYLTLKDESACTSVAFWGLKLNNSNGDHVEIIGKVDYYAKTNNINFIGRNIKNIGIGHLHQEYENLYKKYERLGYYGNKKDLPISVSGVGIITSLDGAALQDFIYVLKQKKFTGDLHVYNCAVQGSGCVGTVVAGIKYFNNSPLDIDIIVVTRGGGSFEDLMGYSHPQVIEAIHNSSKYVISAVGHEVDNMLSDYVANYRAPTPSIAGEVVASIGSNEMNRVDKLEKCMISIKQKILHSLYRYRETITGLKGYICDPYPDILDKMNKIIELNKKYIRDKLESFKHRIKGYRDSVNSTNPDYILKQGFILITHDNGNIVESINNIFGNTLKMIHSSGTYDVKIIENIEK